MLRRVVILSGVKRSGRIPLCDRKVMPPDYSISLGMSGRERVT
jgi:hypothetical protein